MEFLTTATLIASILAFAGSLAHLLREAVSRLFFSQENQKRKVRFENQDGTILEIDFDGTKIELEDAEKFVAQIVEKSKSFKSRQEKIHIE